MSFGPGGTDRNSDDEAEEEKIDVETEIRLSHQNNVFMFLNKDNKDNQVSKSLPNQNRIASNLGLSQK